MKEYGTCYKKFKKNKPIILMIHIPFNTDKSPTLERDMGGSYKGNKRFALHAHEHLIGN